MNNSTIGERVLFDGHGPSGTSRDFMWYVCLFAMNIFFGHLEGDNISPTAMQSSRLNIHPILNMEFVILSVSNLKSGKIQFSFQFLSFLISKCSTRNRERSGHAIQEQSTGSCSDSSSRLSMCFMSV